MLLLLFSGCVQTHVTPEDTKLFRSAEYQAEIDSLLAADAENKKWERSYLKEIAIAQEHNDLEAYRFFLEEFLRIPRFKLPAWLKKEPGYVKPISLDEL